MTRSRLRWFSVEVGATAIIIALLWAYTSSNESYAVAPLGDVLEAFRATWLFEHVGSDVVPSLVRMTLGYAAAIAIGVAGGFLLGSSAVVNAVASPVVGFLRSIPAAALLPPAIVLFGIGGGTKVAVIAFVCCWPIMLNTSDGVRELDSTMLATARVYGIRGLQRFRLVVLPAVSPRIFAGMRTSLSIAILLLVTSEMIASTNGIGYFVFQAQQQFSVDDMWAGVLLLGLLGFTLNLAFGAVERRVLHWNARDDRSK
ncbi:ABC transporter permease [Conexibacter arvalis]|uniref:ABC-type nitrate/sulfonate/bicarbonate transport system permease component n=1 Tax=Conexibacter arvalis TaxID=912552 RepID=A0A840IAA2_9ACTN|nr:ABC transporter permease subunit [Conexibacter arvalis]MBB4661847.1 ABC-type nitrate/sulfonate/bicarbonate transport system permease component [Conexibacter arvalis]